MPAGRASVPETGAAEGALKLTLHRSASVPQALVTASALEATAGVPKTGKSFWRKEKVEPVLKQLLSFARAPGVLATFIAAELDEVQIAPGQAIFELGSPATSLIVLLEGSIELHSREIGAVGVAGPGASLGEVALMGLLDVRTATAVAKSGCKLVEITRELLSRPKFRVAKEALQCLARERREQVQLGLPLASLPIGMPAENLCASAVALHTSRIVFPPGDIWAPLPDAGPNGPHFGVFGSGEASIELLGGRWVAGLREGSIVPEGLLSERGAIIRPESACVGFRLRQADLLLAVGSGSVCREWYERLRFHEKQVRDSLSRRIDGAQSVDDAAPDPQTPVAATGVSPSGRERQGAPSLRDPYVFPVSYPGAPQTPMRRPAGFGRHRMRRTTSKSSHGSLQSSSQASQRLVPRLQSSKVFLQRRSPSLGRAPGGLPILEVSCAETPKKAKAKTHGWTRAFNESGPGDLLQYTLPKRPATAP